MKRLRVLLILLGLLVLPGAILLAQGSGDGVAFVQFVSEGFGLHALVPEGWPQVTQGGYARFAADDDPTVIYVQSVPLPRDQVTSRLVTNLGIEALPQESTLLQTASFAWDVYTFEVEVAQLGTTIRFDLALSEASETTYLVLQQTTLEDYDSLHETVFLPVLDSVARLTWGPDDPGIDPAAEVQALVLQVLEERPHDSGAYTQGLLLYNGFLYESTGGSNYSSIQPPSLLRQVDPQTGEVLQQIELDENYFGEGLERVDDRLIQITWQEETAFIYDIETFEQVGTFSYDGEGWGLCYDGQYLYMSDGSAVIDIRDPQTFEVVYEGLVTLSGQPVQNINELECVGEYIYANVWMSDEILQIDKRNGQVVAVINAEGLLSEAQAATINPGSDVLNGIVYVPESDTFLITGKRWPALFEVTFVTPES